MGRYFVALKIGVQPSRTGCFGRAAPHLARFEVQRPCWLHVGLEDLEHVPMSISAMCEALLACKIAFPLCYVQ